MINRQQCTWATRLYKILEQAVSRWNKQPFSALIRVSSITEVEIVVNRQTVWTSWTKYFENGAEQDIRRPCHRAREGAKTCFRVLSIQSGRTRFLMFSSQDAQPSYCLPHEQKHWTPCSGARWNWTRKDMLSVFSHRSDFRLRLSAYSDHSTVLTDFVLQMTSAKAGY